MKKFLSLIMAIALVLSLCIIVSADEETTNPPATNTGSITITNATIGQTYKAYKIFSASYDDTSSGNKAVSYIIDEDCPYAAILLGTLPSGKKLSDYFNYAENTGSVTKKDATVDSELIAYLTEVVNQDTDKYVATEEADESTITFTGLDYGYYLIISSLGAIVTINSNTPHVDVIDKNQSPAAQFSKEIATARDEDNKPIAWGRENSACIGDLLTYKIKLTATNYFGDQQIQYYQIHDTKGSAIWADFSNITVSVGGNKLSKGYYLCRGDADKLNPTGKDHLEFLGDWGETTEKDRDDADWYLVQISEDEFRITIPWLTNHYVEDVKDSSDKIVSYSLKFLDGAKSKFNSPAAVEIIYDATIEANATIGGGSETNLYNKAYAEWTSANESDSCAECEVVTKVYGLGILKDDAATKQNLAGAEFRLYADPACSEPINIIPTNIKGVYIVDGYDRDGHNIHGAKQCVRTVYSNYLEDYLGADYASSYDNLVRTPVNGKVVVLGLAAGTYYLKETKAPDGYNALPSTIELTAGTGMTAFNVFANPATGDVADIQTTDGTHTLNVYTITHTTVHNSQGVELPSTGGTGTMLLITIGSIVAMAFAVLLITHKKMSVYTD